MKKLILSTLALACVFLAGCASSLGGSTYSRTEARGEMSVRMGTVVSIRDVQIEGQGTVGALTGAAVGGLAGAGLNDGRTGTALAILGAARGAVLGNTVNKAVTQAPGIEVTVKMPDGRLTAIVQERDTQLNIKVGDQVRIVGSGSNTRVTPL